MIVSLELANLELDIQNPYEYSNIPDLSTLELWANSALQKNDDAKVPLSVVIRIVDEAESAELNNDFRGKDYATNVLSFPFEKPSVELLEEYGIDPAQLEELDDNHLGDLVICEPVLQKEAIQQNKSLEQHWAHLLVHGVLHLQGYDHISDQEAEIMETLEVEILGKLGFENPYNENSGDNET